MKKVAVLLMFLGAFAVGCASLEVATPEQKTFQTVITADGKSKSDIYKSTLEWFAQSFVSSNDVIQYKDEASGRIIGKIEVPIKLATIQPGIARVTVTIEIKANKARATFVYNDAYDSAGRYDIFTSHLQELNKKMTAISNTLEDKIKSKSSF